MLSATTILWAVLVSGGAALLWRYASQPGPASQISQVWPSDTSIQRAKTKFTLIMALHPQCPCSHATIAELSKLLAQCSYPPAVQILCIRPADAGNAFTNTSLIREAAALPGVSIVLDPDGAEAARFGVKTSGQTMLFDSNGQLLFSGGITSARGHEGDNSGSDALVLLLTGKTPLTQMTPVFGCSLFDTLIDTNRAGLRGSDSAAAGGF